MRRLIAGIFMVTGTTIGGGMVVLPAVMGVYGYFSAILILTLIWLLNTMIALVFLEANCYLPLKTSFISLSRRFLGPYGSAFCWMITLVFLYTIMCVYITGVTEIVMSFLESVSLSTPSYIISILAVSCISIPLFKGVRNVSRINQFIVISMFILFGTLTAILIPNIKLDLILGGTNILPYMALPIGFTSFGFLVIIPSLRELLDDNVRHLKIAIIVGSLIPLSLYLLWVTIIMGVIPVNGDYGLQAILKDSESVKFMSEALHVHSGYQTFAWLIKLFMLFAILSSYIGTSLGLHDFLADGFRAKEQINDKIKVLSLTFIPPLLIALMLPRLYIIGLGFAGLVSTILFGLYPVMLTWSARYRHQLKTKYHAPVNRSFLVMIALFAFLIIFIELYSLMLDLFV